MKSLIALFLLTISTFTHASSIKVSAFTAFYICQNDEGTNHEELCMISIYHKPNVSIPMKNGSGEILLDHSMPELGLDFNTKVNVKQINDTIYFSLFTLRDGVKLIGPLEVSIKSITDLETKHLYGKDICIDEDCSRYYRPFLYLGQPWVSELE